MLRGVWKPVGSSSAPAGPCSNLQGSAVLGLRTGRLVRQGFLLLLTVHSLPFLTSTIGLGGGACPIPPFQAAYQFSCHLYTNVFLLCEPTYFYIECVKQAADWLPVFYLTFNCHLAGRVIN